MESTELNLIESLVESRLAEKDFEKFKRENKRTLNELKKHITINDEYSKFLNTLEHI